jgi:hypothetical protein
VRVTDYARKGIRVLSPVRLELGQRFLAAFIVGHRRFLTAYTCRHCDSHRSKFLVGAELTGSVPDADLDKVADSFRTVHRHPAKGQRKHRPAPIEAQVTASSPSDADSDVARILQIPKDKSAARTPAPARLKDRLQSTKIDQPYLGW